MSRHSFDPVIAKQVGLNAATIYQNILCWAERNAANNKHSHDGYIWTYNSIAAFGDLFPYLTLKQIRTALMKLEDEGLIVSGCYNKSAYDRTKWYAPTCPLGKADLPSGANEIAQKGEPIPDINTNNKPIKNISAHEMPDDWEPMRFKVGSVSRDIVDSWPPETYVPTLEAFVAYHRSRGNKFKNWQDAWSNWVLNSRKFKNGTTNRTTGQPRNQNGFAAALRYVADGRPDEPF